MEGKGGGFRHNHQMRELKTNGIGEDPKFLKYLPKKTTARPTWIYEIIMSECDVFGATIQSSRESATRVASTPNERVAALYEANRERIYAFLVSQGLAPAKAQELTQDAFVNLFVALEKGNTIAMELAWLYKVAAKLAVDHWRREGRSMWVELESVPTVADNLRSKEPTPEAAALRRQRSKRVASALARLPKEQRLGIHLRMQGLRYREIAKILNVSVPAVSGLLSSAVERLRSIANE